MGDEHGGDSEDRVKAQQNVGKFSQWYQILPCPTTTEIHLRPWGVAEMPMFVSDQEEGR